MNWKIVRLMGRAKRYCFPKYLFLEIKRGLRRYKKIKGLTSINLSTTTRCSVDCIFCPQKRGANNTVDFISLQSVSLILDQLKSREFKKFHNIVVVSVGENGDFFLHKDCIAILKMIRSSLPGVKIQCFSNFRMFTKDKIDAVLRYNLLDYVGCNIDGANAKNYSLVKKGDYQATTDNFLYFVNQRKRLWRDIPILLSALTFHDYVKGIYFNLGILPSKVSINLKDIEKLVDDFSQTMAQYRHLLDHPKDKIMRSCAVGWAERKYVDSRLINYKDHTCPQLERIEKEAFIAPDGSWYACCWDGENELKLGNVLTASINEIFFSKARENFIELLKNKRFGEIGGPCSTVNCCQKLEPHEKTK